MVNSPRSTRPSTFRRVKIDELGRADAVAGYVTISSLNRALERERAAARDRPAYED